MFVFATVIINSIAMPSWGQYVLDWAKAPLNPYPGTKYTLNHYNMIGDVSSREFGEVRIEFKAGKQTLEKTLSISTTYSYNEKGHLATMKSTGAFVDDIVEFKCNLDGEIVEIYYPKYKSGSNVIYNSNGLFTEERSLKTKKLIASHVYDSKGRIVLSTSFDDDEAGKLASKTTYTYLAVSPKLIVVEKRENTTLPKEYDRQDTLVYDSHGHLASRNGKPITLPYDAQGNLTMYHNVERNLFYKYHLTYGGNQTSTKPKAGTDNSGVMVKELFDRNAMLKVDGAFLEEIKLEMTTLAAVQKAIMKLSSTSLVPWQKRDITTKANNELKKLRESIELAKKLMVERAEMAKSINYTKEVLPSLEVKQKLGDASTKLVYLMDLLSPKEPFESYSDEKWKNLSEDLNTRLVNMARDIITARNIIWPEEERKESTSTATMKTSEKNGLLTDLEMHRLAFMNLGLVEMRESIDHDFYIAALRASGNQSELQKLLTDERKRQLQLAVKVAGLMKQADTAITITQKLQLHNLTNGYVLLRQEFVKLHSLSIEIGREIESNGDFSKKDATALMAIVHKTQPDMKKAIDIVFGMIEKIPAREMGIHLK